MRAGAGSLRDRAELMVMLLAAAGIPATIKAMKTPGALTAAELYRPRANPTFPWKARVPRHHRWPGST